MGSAQRKLNLSLKNLQHAIYGVAFILTPLVLYFPESYPAITVFFVGASYLISRKVEKNAALLNKIIATFPSMISILELKSTTRFFVNSQVEKILGFSFGELNRMTDQQLDELVHPEDREKYVAIRSQQFSPQTDSEEFFQIEFRARKKDNTYAFLRSRIIPFEKDSDGKITQFLSLTDDVTTEKALLQELETERIRHLNHEKIAALGEMAGGMAHEINNPLAIILGHTQTLKMKLKRGGVSEEDLTNSLQKIEATSKRISKVVNSLRMIARDGLNDEFVDAQLTTAIDDIQAFWGQRLANHDIKLEIEYFDPGMTAYCRPVQIVLVLLNLIGNSFHAVKGLDEKWIKIQVSERADFIDIRVTDSGHGIPDKIQDKVFNPFFTTKAVGEGSGLGLSVASGIAKVHNGSLTIDPRSPNTSFILSLPKSKPQTAAQAA